jgi:type II secretory pathway pseudopilin PulG
MPFRVQSEPRQIEGRDVSGGCGEEGFMLLGVVVLVALLLIALSVAAPVVARQLRRDKEIESQHRMEEYVRAIQLYQRKFPGQYPASIKVLEGSNNVRFLRHVYIDPLTGKADYKLIHQGEQKTKIHVFFGEELAGLSGGLGSAAGMASSGGMGTPLGGGGSTTVNATNALGGGFSGATIGDQGGTGASGAGTSGTGGSTAPGSTTSGSTDASNGTSGFGDGTGGVIVGVGTAKSGTSITEPNGQSTYETWEFWYDPRIEMLRKAVSLTGGGMSSQSATGLGQSGTMGQPDSGTNALGGSQGAGGSNGTSGTTGSTGSTGTTGSSTNPNSPS